MNPAGGGVSAWVSAEPNGTPAVAVREDFPDGAVQTALVGGGAAGPIGELAVGRSGLGDGLIAFQQGALGDAAIVAAAGDRPARGRHHQRAEGLDQALPGAGQLDAVAQRRRAAHLPRRAGRARAGSARREPASCGSIPAGSAAATTKCSCLRPTSTVSPRSALRVTLQIDAGIPTVKISALGQRRRSRCASATPTRASMRRRVSVSFGDGHSARGKRVLHAPLRACRGLPRHVHVATSSATRAWCESW